MSYQIVLTFFFCGTKNYKRALGPIDFNFMDKNNETVSLCFSEESIKWIFVEILMPIFFI